MFFRERDHLRPPGKLLAEPFLPPGRDDLDLRGQRRRRQLEAHLIVSLARGAMRNGPGAFALGDLDHALGDQRPRDAGAEKILPLVDGSRLHDRENEIARELLPQIVHLATGRARGERLGFEAVEFFLLADIGAKRDHLRVVRLLEPAQDDGGIQPSRISDNDSHRLAEVRS